jgi:Adenosyl cobinamide kinase/adenosyl cobinamide phosphate guanylyltransferase
VSIILIGGGSRSGKSSYALDCARLRGSRLAFIATAQTLDEEMRARAEAHQRDRGTEFETFEEPVELARIIDIKSPSYDAIVIDCLTLWLSNLMLQGTEDIARETRGLLSSALQAKADVILVTNEVGCGIVPDNELARRFRDAAGTLKAAAEVATEVYWMAFGCPLRLK